jgi:hypothetical protein
MNNLIQKVEDLKEQLTRSNGILLQVVAKIKDEMSDTYYKYISNPEVRALHHALMLCLGTYSDRYSDKVGKYKIERVKIWKTGEYHPYCDLYGDTYVSTRGLIGFVCYKKDFFLVLDQFWDVGHKDLWMYAIKDKRYLKGLQDFVDEYSKDFDKSYELFREFIAHKNSKLDKNCHQVCIVNYKPLKIKDVVIYTNDNI